MNRAEHYRKAEEILANVKGLPISQVRGLLTEALIHATLANVPANVSVIARLDAEEEQTP